MNKVALLLSMMTATWAGMPMPKITSRRVRFRMRRNDKTVNKAKRKAKNKIQAASRRRNRV